jgi:hypothetical protein
MEPPPWEQKVSFKHALALAAVLKRKHDKQAAELNDKCSALKHQVEILQVKHASLQRDTSAERLRAFMHGIGNDHAIPPIASLEQWNRAIDSLPQHASLLSHLHEYTVLQSLSTALCFSESEPVPGLVAAALQLTPARALVSVLTDMMKQSVERESMRRVVECLSDFCAISHDVMTPEEDVDALQNFCLQMLMAASGLQDVTCLPVDNNVDTGTAEAKGQPDDGSLTAAELLTILQKHSTTGMLVMASAAYCLQSILKKLAGDITGEFAGTAATEAQGLSNESNILTASQQIASLLHKCLRDLPDWISLSEVTIDDDFLSGIASAVWSSAELGSIISPLHPEVARQSQRSAALLISALQRISAPSS